MLLAIDIGNTNVTVGVFQEEELLATWRLATDTRKMPDEYALLIQNLLPLKGVMPQGIHGIALCSGVPPLGERLTGPCPLSPGCRVGSALATKKSFDDSMSARCSSLMVVRRVATNRSPERRRGSG